MELKKMSDQELAQRMVNYIDRLVALHQNISDYLNKKDFAIENRTIIQAEYCALKEELSADAKYVSGTKNACGSPLYEGFFIPSIQECIAKGFQAPKNSAVNSKMSSSVYDAKFYMTYYHNRDAWYRIANS